MDAQSQTPILDIRRSKFEDSIPDLVVDGLSKQPKTLPALLFYSTEGIEHWKHHSQGPEFYPRLEEICILKKRAHEMASSIAQNSIVVDMGSASIDKVILLLEALEAQGKDVAYYALDLSVEQHAATLQAIPTQNFKHVRFAALHGTFEDGLHWLKETPRIRNLPHCILLFGLTIGNYSRQNAAEFLRNIADHALTASPGGSAILVTIDSCKVPTKVLRAYTSEGVVPFALTALAYANTLMSQGRDAAVRAFNPEDWYYLSEWNFAMGRHEASLVPRNKAIELGAPLDGIVVSRDEKVRFGCSYKYDQEEREALFAAAGLRNTAVWSDQGCDVAFYELKLGSA
ncbi:hypothetical protein DL770_000726 [Monosporascus sp. CRB-9-2]|nr:hypothetical protein DL770_000726 [Monosporascus sp. CRB-9-2]